MDEGKLKEIVRQMLLWSNQQTAKKRDVADTRALAESLKALATFSNEVPRFNMLLADIVDQTIATLDGEKIGNDAGGDAPTAPGGRFVVNHQGEVGSNPTVFPLDGKLL